jgi:hypothetical protein
MVSIDGRDTSPKQHLGKGEEFGRRRHEPGSAGWKRRRCAPLAIRPVIELKGTGLGIGAVTGGEPTNGVGRYRETGVLHAERFKDSLSQERLKGLPGRPGDENSEHIGTGVIEPTFTGLTHERQRRETAHPLVGFGRERRLGWTDAQLKRSSEVVDRARPEVPAEAHPERQQISHRDGAPCRHRVVDGSVDSAYDASVGKFGQKPFYRLVQPQDALFKEDHCGQRGDRLGH